MKKLLIAIALIPLDGLAAPGVDEAQLPLEVAGFRREASTEVPGPGTELAQTRITYRKGSTTARVFLYPRPEEQHDGGISLLEIQEELVLRCEDRIAKENPSAEVFYRAWPEHFGHSKVRGYNSAWVLNGTGSITDDSRFLRVYLSARANVFVRVETIAMTQEEKKRADYTRFVEGFFQAALGETVPRQ